MMKWYDAALLVVGVAIIVGWFFVVMHQFDVVLSLLNNSEYPYWEITEATKTVNMLKLDSLIAVGFAFLAGLLIAVALIGVKKKPATSS